MSSIIEGYNYDIFISYRQKDNKYDGWVTEFVDNLKRELESMFKDEVSVYFDINPQDGLLETHDVDASLEKKLKCLIFIPIISRTYCDLRSFAWDHEFKAFIEQASLDRFGFKVTLPNGNVANRLLPVRINDLDNIDIKLLESILGGVFRGVDFIYKESGVNRPLRSNEDNPHDNLNHTIYRNQINKVALAVRDIIESMKVSVSPEQTKHKEIHLNEGEEKGEIKEPGGKEIIKPEQEARANKTKPEKEKKYPLLRKSRVLIPGILGILVFLFALFLLLNRISKIRWAKEKALPEIEQRVNEGDFLTAFNLVQKSGKYISNNLKFRKLASRVTRNLAILTDPPGADAYIREYSDIEGEWKKLGRTPIDSIKLPNVTYFTMGVAAYEVRFEKEGYENVLAVILTKPDTLFRKLFKNGTIPVGMVYVEGYKEEEAGAFLKEKHGFFIDRYEVTNKQYKDFVDKGGYNNPVYWKNKFIKEGKVLTWKEAIARFTDKTGRNGPSVWSGGDYAEGQDNYPVSGISWYEAAAYAEFAGKNLPTADHWGSSAGFYMPNTVSYFCSKIIPVSNFNNKGTEPIEKLLGVNSYGAYGMAGNVREWCWNETEFGRIIRGGAWDDASYMYSNLSQLPPFDRSAKNGFRCVQYINKEKVPELAFQPIKDIITRDVLKEKSVPDNIFKIYKNQFLYDRKELIASIDKKDETHDDYIIEKISYTPAYGDERGISFLYLPKHAVPPFQTVIFFPGSAVQMENNLITSEYSTFYVDYIVKNGRAVMFPVYNGTFERKKDLDFPVQSHQNTEYLIELTKELSRSIDYLETRSDIDINKLAFYGVSWGGALGGIIPAVEDRLKLSILVKGGFDRTQAYPEADAINYVPRIRIPVLMLNGIYDASFPYETTVKPLFDLLGTPVSDKRLCTYKTDHYIPRDELIKETLNWMDKYFGPVK